VGKAALDQAWPLPHVGQTDCLGAWRVAFEAGGSACVDRLVRLVLAFSLENPVLFEVLIEFLYCDVSDMFEHLRP